MWSAILESLQNFWNWLMGVLAVIGKDALNWILGFLPNDWLANISSASSVVGWAFQLANAWVPIDVAITYVVVFVIFIITWLGAKILIKLIP